jgi:hypothetical protein
MTTTLSALLDLPLAWKRVKLDLKHCVFVRHPFDLELIESDLVGWLSELTTAITSGTYHPQPMVVCDVPKDKGTIRPGSHLAMNDRVVFAASVGASLPYIQTALSWSQGTVDFSYQLSHQPNEPEWLRNKYDGWKNFEKRTLDAFTDGVTHVIFTDITAYYENIVLEILMSDLRQLGAPEQVVVQLSSMLNKWAEAPGRGLPQGQAPSDILAKVYLNSIDESLQTLGITHFRYVDDYRILCRSENEAKVTLMTLTRLLRKRGLSLQTAKTCILPVEEARNSVESLTRVLVTVRDQFLAEAKDYFDISGYMPFDEYEKMLKEVSRTDAIDPQEAPIHVIREAFEQHFSKADHTGFIVKGLRPTFDKSLFHFLLNRLGKAGDDFAVAYCLSLLPRRPEETEAVLKYLERIKQVPACDDAMAEFLSSAESLYAYQKYQIADWRLQNSAPCSEKLLGVFKHLAFDNTLPAYLIASCRAILGRFGTAADLERLQSFYSNARGELEQCEIICCLGRMEANRRNTFLARVKQDSALHIRAVNFAKAVKK